MVQICFPEGFHVTKYEKKREDELCKMRVFHFIITNQEGEKKYVTSLSFKELLLTDYGSYIVPKSLCVLSSRPVFTLQKQLLTVIFQKVILSGNSLAIKAFQNQHSVTSIVETTHSLSLSKAIDNSDNYLKQRFEFYISVFFNHIYYSEGVEHDIEIEGKRRRGPIRDKKTMGSSSALTMTENETFFRYRNTKS